MSKLYVSCIVVALLALAVMPAIAAGNLVSGSDREVVVTATVPDYINLDVDDSTIDFPDLVATNVGYRVSYDANPPGVDAVPTTDNGWSKHVISTNVRLWDTVNSGDDLTAPLSDNPSYEIELQFSTSSYGWLHFGIAIPSLDWILASGGTWSGGLWTGCGAGKANDPDGKTLMADNGIGTFCIQECQKVTLYTRARLYQDGINDPAGDYIQDTNKLTTTIYTSEPVGWEW